MNLSAARLGYVLAAVLMPGGIALDLICVPPDKVIEFLLIRFGASVIACAMIGASYLPPIGRHPVLLGAGAPLLCAVGIAASSATRANGRTSLRRRRGWRGPRQPCS